MVLKSGLWLVFFFFFQAEDGIRDLIVTGVQTCALPIYEPMRRPPPRPHRLIRPPSAARRAHGDRKSVVWGKSVDLGGRRIIKKKTITNQNLRVSRWCVRGGGRSQLQDASGRTFFFFKQKTAYEI